LSRILYFFIFPILLSITAYFLFLKPDHIEKHPVSIAVSKTPLSSPFYIAKSINAFENTCVEVEYHEVLGGVVAFDKVIEGEVDFSTTSDSVITFKSLANHDFVTHAMFVQSDNDVKLLTQRSKNFTSISKLKGSKIGVTKGSASEYFLSTLLAIEGLSVDDVELYDYKPEDLINGIENNEVDAVVPWEPFAFNIINKLTDQVDIQETKNINTLSFNLISKRADDLMVKKATCIIQGLNIAIAYIASNPEESKKIVIKELNLEHSFIDWVWDDYIFKLGLNQSLILNIKSQAAWAIEMQMSEHNATPNVNDFLDSRAMLQVDPSAVNIPL